MADDSNVIRASEGRELLRQAIRERVLPELNKLGFSRFKPPGVRGETFAFRRITAVDELEVHEVFGMIPKFHKLDPTDGIHFYYTVSWPALAEALSGLDAPDAGNPQISVSLSNLTEGVHWHPLFVHGDYDAAVLGEQVLRAWGVFEQFGREARRLPVAAERYLRSPYAWSMSAVWTAPLAWVLLGNFPRAMDEWVAWRWSPQYDWMAKGRGNDGTEQALYDELGAILASLEP